MRKEIIITAIMAFVCIGAQAQEVKIEEPKGKAIVQLRLKSHRISCSDLLLE